MNLYNELCSIIGENNVLRDEPMSSHTTFRIGGPADYFVMPSSAGEIRRITELCTDQKIPYYVIGNGSNLLVGDKGYRDVIIQVFKNMRDIQVEGETVRAQAGALLSKVAAAAYEAELEGFEFASGIPGTLGGAVRMNAGAYGGEIKHVLKSAEVLTPEGEVLTLSAEEMKLGYRTSIVSKMDYVVLGAELSLKKGKKEEIRAKMDELKEKRVSKQPLEYGSAGSTFKRPEGYFAGKLIEDAGLRGFRVGNAQVSEKHCGFVINLGGATAREVSELMESVVRKVEAASGVRLEPEVKRIGEF